MNFKKNIPCLLKQKSLTAYVISGIAFLEAIILPVPVEFFLIPACLRESKKIWKWVGLAAGFSVLGGIFSYVVGWYASAWVLETLSAWNLSAYVAGVRLFYAQFGELAIFLSAVTPIPYKIFTITSGVMNASIFWFVLLSFLGRFMRFFMVVWLVSRFGSKVYERFETYFWWGFFAVVLFYLLLKFI